MADLNNVSLTGRLTKDSVLRKAGSYDLLEFTIAVNGIKKEDTFFMNVNLWGKTAVSMSKYLEKGKQVGVTGNLKQDSWEDREGNTRLKWSINCNQVTLLGGRMEEKERQDSDDEETEDIPF
jgi:single-strand DNA-binding protein